MLRCKLRLFVPRITIPGGVFPIVGHTGRVRPKGVPFFKLAVYKRVGKIAILVDEGVSKSAGKWKKWWLKRSISKGATFDKRE